MDRSGQSLVMFILFLPLIIIVMVGIVEIGDVLVNQKQLDSINHECITSGNVEECLKINNVSDYQHNGNSLILHSEVNGVIYKYHYGLTSKYVLINNRAVKE